MVLSQRQFCTLLALVSLAVLVFETSSFVQPTSPNAGIQAAERQLALSQKGVAMEEGRANVNTVGQSSNGWRMIAAVCAAVLVALMPLSGAEAARSGGRMGGMGGGGARRTMPPPQAQRQEAVRPGPNISVGVGPMIAPPMYGSPFLGPPMGFFGPPLLIPGPSFGPSSTDRALQDQQQRDERLLDTQKMQIESLQRELADLKAKKQ